MQTKIFYVNKWLKRGMEPETRWIGRSAIRSGLKQKSESFIQKQTI